MCNLCNTNLNERKAEQDRCRAQAAEMRRLATVFDRLASGELLAHGPMAKHTGQALENLFRELNEDWMQIPIERAAN
jgi:hypothetical protein